MLLQRYFFMLITNLINWLYPVVSGKSTAWIPVLLIGGILLHSASLIRASFYACRPSGAGSPPWVLTASTWLWRPKTIWGLVWSTSSAMTFWVGWRSSNKDDPSLFSSWLVVWLKSDFEKLHIDTWISPHYSDVFMHVDPLIWFI